MALTAHKTRYVQKVDGIRVRNMNVAASETIYNGSIVAVDAAGNAIAALGTQLLKFVGVAKDGYDETTAVATTDSPLVVETGQVERFTIAAATDIDLGKPVYYVDDGSVQIAAPGVVTTQVGTILKVLTATSIMVDTSKSVT